MKNKLLALLLVGISTAALAQNNPFVPPKANAATPTATSPAALAGVPMNPGGAPVGPDGRPLPPYVPPVPGALAPSSGAASQPTPEKPEVRVKFVGKVNGQNVYRGDSEYHFDKKKRPTVTLVEDASTGPVAETPAATQ